MIGDGGKVDGSIKPTHLKIGNGIKTGKRYSKKMVMVGGGLSLKELIHRSVSVALVT